MKNRFSQITPLFKNLRFIYEEGGGVDLIKSESSEKKADSNMVSKENFRIVNEWVKNDLAAHEKVKSEIGDLKAQIEANTFTGLTKEQIISILSSVDGVWEKNDKNPEEAIPKNSALFVVGIQAALKALDPDGAKYGNIGPIDGVLKGSRDNDKKNEQVSKTTDALMNFQANYMNEGGNGYPGNRTIKALINALKDEPYKALPREDGSLYKKALENNPELLPKGAIKLEPKEIRDDKYTQLYKNNLDSLNDEKTTLSQWIYDLTFHKERIATYRGNLVKIFKQVGYDFNGLFETDTDSLNQLVSDIITIAEQENVSPNMNLDDLKQIDIFRNTNVDYSYNGGKKEKQAIWDQIRNFFINRRKELKEYKYKQRLLNDKEKVLKDYSESNQIGLIGDGNIKNFWLSNNKLTYQSNGVTYSLNLNGLSIDGNYSQSFDATNNKITSKLYNPFYKLTDENYHIYLFVLKNGYIEIKSRDEEYAFAIVGKELKLYSKFLDKPSENMIPERSWGRGSFEEYSDTSQSWSNMDDEGYIDGVKLDGDKDKRRPELLASIIGGDTIGRIEKAYLQSMLKVLGPEKFLKYEGDKWFNRIQDDFDKYYDNIEKLASLKKSLDHTIESIGKLPKGFENAELYSEDAKGYREWKFKTKEFEDTWNPIMKFCYRREKQCSGFTKWFKGKLEGYRKELETREKKLKYLFGLRENYKLKSNGKTIDGYQCYNVSKGDTIVLEICIGKDGKIYAADRQDGKNYIENDSVDTFSYIEDLSMSVALSNIDIDYDELTQNYIQMLGLERGQVKWVASSLSMFSGLLKDTPYKNNPSHSISYKSGIIIIPNPDKFNEDKKGPIYYFDLQKKELHEINIDEVDSMIDKINGK